MERILYIHLIQNNPNPKEPFRKVKNKIVFQKRSDYQRFVKHLDILDTIQSLKPQSIYALAQHLKKDVANIAKIAAFYEKVGVIKMKKSKVNGRTAKNAWVEYDQITFQIGARIPTRSGAAVLGLVRRRV